MAKPHFNKGVVRGRIIDLRDRKTKAPGRKPYGDIKVHCPSEEYGDITVRLRFWGSDYADLKEAHKKSTKQKDNIMFHFAGHVGIVVMREVPVIVFNAYKFKPWVPSIGDEARASFIIEGINQANFGEFELHHIREDNSFPVDCVFKFPELDERWGSGPNDRLVVYGHFKDKHAKYGGSGEVQPDIEDVTIKERGR